MSRRAVALRAALLAAALAASLYLAAYLHTTHGANFGCWPEPFPPLPASVEYHLELYCGS